ncbi:MAG: hypothetical protein SGPRY_007369 [Prymnesium sp.]
MAQQAASSKFDPSLVSAASAAQAGQAVSALDSLTKVLGSPQGSTLRRVARDLDSTNFMLSLASPAARPVRRLAVSKLQQALTSAAQHKASQLAATIRLPRLGAGREGAVATTSFAEFDGRVIPRGGPKDGGGEVVAWPSTKESVRMQERAGERARRSAKLLFRHHWQRQLAAGWRGLAAVGALLFVVLRVGVAALARTAGSSAVAFFSKSVPAVRIAALALVAASGALLPRLKRRSSAE